MYGLFHGPKVLTIKETLSEILKEEKKQPKFLRPFLLIGKKAEGYWMKVGKEELKTEESVKSKKKRGKKNVDNEKS